MVWDLPWRPIETGSPGWGASHSVACLPKGTVGRAHCEGVSDTFNAGASFDLTRWRTGLHEQGFEPTAAQPPQCARNRLIRSWGEYDCALEQRGDITV